MTIRCLHQDIDMHPNLATNHWRSKNNTGAMMCYLTNHIDTLGIVKQYSQQQPDQIVSISNSAVLVDKQTNRLKILALGTVLIIDDLLCLSTLCKQRSEFSIKIDKIVQYKITTFVKWITHHIRKFPQQISLQKIYI